VCLRSFIIIAKYYSIVAFQMLKTEKGKDVLCYDYGYTFFLKEKENDTKSIWKCNQYYKNKCRGRLRPSEGKILKNADHNHVLSSSDIQKNT